jgi:predicted PurR-regulated permease PerM
MPANFRESSSANIASHIAAPRRRRVISTAISFLLLTAALLFFLAVIVSSAQLVGLERRVTRGGRDSIDHAPNSHDDLANAVAGAADLVANSAGANPPRFGSYASGYIKVFDDQPTNIANPQSAPCTLVFPKTTAVDERHFKIIRSLRIW